MGTVILRGTLIYANCYHSIGQKLSERIESFHFTHLVNSLRREIHVELGTSSVRNLLRPGHVGIMALPVSKIGTIPCIITFSSLR